MERFAFRRCFPISAQHQRAAVLRAVAPSSVDQVATAEAFFEAFLSARQQSGDLISRVSDRIWSSELSSASSPAANEKLARLQKLVDTNLKAPQTTRWSTLEDETLLRTLKEKDEYRRSSLLEYEALKREFSLMTLSIGLACSLYCAAVLSVEAAVSYGIGVAGSLLYIQLLGSQVDGTSKESVPQVFMPRRGRRRIGITSEDLADSLEKNLRGIAFALSSPRLLLPVAMYALWIASNRLHEDIPSSFQLEIAPMILGFLAYKAAAIVQVYRDNRGLLVSFPEDETEEMPSADE